MRISYINRVKDAILSATNENLNRPVTNLAHNFLELAFFATGNNSVITVTFDDTYDINHIAFDYHNIDSMTARFYDEFDILIDSEIIDVDENCNFHTFDTIEGVEEITLTVSTLDTLLYLGGISIGDYFEMPNFQQSPGSNLNLNDDSFTSWGGQSSGNRKRNLFSYNLTFLNVSNNEKNDIVSYADYVQNSIPHFIDIYEDAHSNFPPFYGKLENRRISMQKRRISDFEWNIELTYREAR